MKTLNNSPLVAIERPATGPARGLLILLHGVGANERSLSALADEQDKDIAVVLPRGPVTLGDDAFGWYPVSFGANGPVLDAAQAEASRKILVEFVAQQQKRLGVSAAQTIVAGFSQGGIMSASIALTAPACVRAFGILSGRILGEIDAMIPANLASYPIEGLVMHGRADTMLPFTLAEASARRLDALGIRHSFLGYDGVGHGMSEAMRADFRTWVGHRLAKVA